MIANSILAHQGGWDEILIIIGPIAAIVGIVALVRRRLHREAEQESGHEGETGVPSPTRGDVLGP
ncbi:MAG: hypothetical protein OXI26_07235 [bacterium]|nr:hypothetical protein [bacterium]